VDGKSLFDLLRKKIRSFVKSLSTFSFPPDVEI
jgi:hypothetical protein